MLKANVTIDPKPDLFFERSDHNEQISHFTITNNSSEIVLFKVKVTHPKEVTVNPAYGHVDAHSEHSVSVKIKQKDTTKMSKYKLQVLIYSRGDILELNAESITDYIKKNSPQEISASVLSCKIQEDSRINIEPEPIDFKNDSPRKYVSMNIPESKIDSSTPLPEPSKPIPCTTPLVITREIPTKSDGSFVKISVIAALLLAILVYFFYFRK
ncbi:hypothetical protein RF11_15845 [Thelohanellus kitauei]|uniref:MSP domain-containing protein n=1 Tax=Thelohanellus kitauei TaxID=669202 RepID=A0A0C2M420_THEKT|nr:hypothetical protein RF11_15845 [Thelohanellus kitauei]